VVVLEVQTAAVAQAQYLMAQLRFQMVLTKSLLVQVVHQTLVGEVLDTQEAIHTHSELLQVVVAEVAERVPVVALGFMVHQGAAKERGQVIIIMVQVQVPLKHQLDLLALLRLLATEVV